MLGTAVVTSGAVIAGGALADHGERTAERYRAGLEAVPHDPAADGGSNASGIAKIKVQGRKARIQIRAARLSPNLPHAVHIHGFKKAGEEIAKCPGAGHRNDLRDDGLIETAEGIEDYGPVQVSLTTRGDTSADSTLALDRFFSGASDGTVSYERTIKLKPSIKNRLDQKHIVIHGHDIDGDGEYDAEPKSAGLGVSLEAEVPVACGELRSIQR